MRLILIITFSQDCYGIHITSLLLLHNSTVLMSASHTPSCSWLSLILYHSSISATAGWSCSSMKFS